MGEGAPKGQVMDNQEMPVGSALTVIIGALLTITPQLLAVVPAPYSDVASAVIAACVAAWHLYQPAPSSSSNK
jgi:hypothetical protein